MKKHSKPSFKFAKKDKLYKPREKVGLDICELNFLILFICGYCYSKTVNYCLLFLS